MGNFIFSSLYNESEEYLPFLVANFLCFTDEYCFLIINIGNQIAVGAGADFGPRVKLIRGEVERAPWGGTLLAGHMESFRYAKRTFGEFSWFTAIASNSLFFRKFDPASAIAVHNARQRRDELPVQWDPLPEYWHWPRLRGYEGVLDRMRVLWGINRMDSYQIEGFFASQDDWKLVSDVQADLANFWNGMNAPLEEILPITVIDSIGNGGVATICHMFWGRMGEPHGQFARLSDMLEPSAFAPHVCMLKWFRRDVTAAETLIVGTKLGQLMLTSLREAKENTKERQQFVTLVGEFFKQIDPKD